MICFQQGVYLGTIDDEHLHLLRRWRNDYTIFKWCRQHDLITETAHIEWYKAIQRDPSIKMYMVIDESRQPIGVCGLTSIDRTNRRAEFSLYIEPSRQNQGYGKAALATLISHGFMNLNLNCIWGETFGNNGASKMFESLGMKKEGTRREFYYREGQFIDAHLYSILKNEWHSKEQVAC